MRLSKIFFNYLHNRRKACLSVKLSFLHYILFQILCIAGLTFYRNNHIFSFSRALLGFPDAQLMAEKVVLSIHFQPSLYRPIQVQPEVMPIIIAFAVAAGQYNIFCSKPELQPM